MASGVLAHDTASPRTWRLTTIAVTRRRATGYSYARPMSGANPGRGCATNQLHSTMRIQPERAARLRGFIAWVVTGVSLGVGTAMVYATLLTAIGDVAHPSWRSSAVGAYRLWRDSGYAVGALLAGVLAGAFGMTVAITAIRVLTAASGVVVAVRMPRVLSRRSASDSAAVVPIA